MFLPTRPPLQRRDPQGSTGPWSNTFSTHARKGSPLYLTARLSWGITRHPGDKLEWLCSKNPTKRTPPCPGHTGRSHWRSALVKFWKKLWPSGCNTSLTHSDSSPPINLGEEKELQYSMQVLHSSRTSSQHGLKERSTQYLPVMSRGSSIMCDTNIFLIL